MNTTRRLKRWIALLLLAATSFAQASVAFSACQVERGQLAQSIGTRDNRPCEDGKMVAEAWTKYTNRCLAHCTADLQIAGVAVAIVRSPGESGVLFLKIGPLPATLHADPDASPPHAVPIRILLHAFLV